MCMAVLRIGSNSWDGVSERIAGNPHDIDVFEGFIDGWTCMFGRTPQQLLVLTNTKLVLVADEGDYPVPLADIVSWEGGLLKTRSYGETRITIPGGSRQEVERLLASRASIFGFTVVPEKFVGMSAASGSGGSSQWRRARNRRMISELVNLGGKYQGAILGDRWASFSIIGTSDWEDYASLSIAAMQLETSTDLDERLERIEGLLNRIATQLEGGLPE